MVNGLLVVLSCLLRYLLEVMGISIQNSIFNENYEWKQYWSDKDCGSESGKIKFVCRTYEICMK